jgi:hypothetical protein
MEISVNPQRWQPFDISRLSTTQHVFYTVKPDYTNQEVALVRLTNLIKLIESSKIQGKYEESTFKIMDKDDGLFGLVDELYWTVSEPQIGIYRFVAHFIWDMPPLDQVRLSGNMIIKMLAWFGIYIRTVHPYHVKVQFDLKQDRVTRAVKIFRQF